jgi:malonate decarboxylase acyl carrier protein
MEHLEFSFSSAPSAAGKRSPNPVLAGVVGSGNFEVLAETDKEMEQTAQFIIDTAAGGFGGTWQAVLGDFASHFSVGGLRFSINDNAATPAVVSLRLRQALEALEEGKIL